MSGAVKHEQWSSKWGFLMAAIGGAVGLGNIWRFPYMTGENGGGAFVLIYLVAVVFVAIPILIAELQLGKRGHRDIISGTEKVAIAAGRSPRWRLIGWLGMLAAFFVLTYYSVVAGQVLDYVVQSLTGGFSGVSPEEARAEFDNLQSNPPRMILWHTVIMAITVGIVARGISGGIEKAAKIMMPAFFVMLMAMFFYAMVVGDFVRGWDYMFSFNFDQVKPETALMAIGQAFFSIGIGFGYMLAYGSYLPKDISIPRTSVIISLADAGVAIIAGLVIFPLVYAFGQVPDEGPDLIFRILPMVFAEMQYGSAVGAVFFILLTFAALSSAIAIMQPAVSYLEEKHGLSVKAAALSVGALAWLIGLGSVFSYNIWAEHSLLPMFETFAGKHVMDVIDYITANYMMLVGGILISVFVGWSFKPGWAESEFQGVSPVFFTIWLWLVRVFAPAAVAIALYVQLSA
ncbi:MAG: sodium-dependent transporter [Proteobacteria bacterium]|nr:sodium-dependent transporter [Pseudomonadota bacterium]